MIATHRAIGPDTHSAPSRIVAGVNTAGAALSGAGCRVITFKRACVPTGRTTIIGIMATCRTMIVTDGAAGIRSLGTFEIARIGMTFEKAIWTIAAGA